MLVPYYKISIQGVSAPKELYTYVQSLKVNNTFHGASSCSIILDDPDMIFIQGSYITEKSLVKIVYGYKEGSKTYTRTFEGYVSVLDANFPEDGKPTVTVHCMDKSHIMNRKEKTRTWTKKKISDVVSSIFRSYGFKVKIDSTSKVLDSIEQSKQTDINFIIKLADEIGYITYIDREMAYFVKRKSKSPSHTLKYRLNPYTLYSFRPRINKESKKLTLKERDIDTNTLTVKTTVNSSSVLTGLGSKKVSSSSSRK